MDLNSLGSFDMKKFMPNFSGVGEALLNFTLVLLLIGGLGYFVYWYLDSKKFKFKIEIYENIGGSTGWTRTGFDRAKLLRIGETGEEVLFLKKRKKMLQAYGKKIALNTYAFAIGQDGYWYNFIHGDFDSKRGMLDIEPIDKDMRLTNIALKRNMEARFQKGSWFDKYGQMLINVIFLIAVLICIGYLVNKIAEVSSGFIEASKAMVEVAKTNQQTLGALDNICSGSGIKTV